MSDSNEIAPQRRSLQKAAEKVPVKKAPGKKAAKKAPGKKAPGKKAPGKKVPGKKAAKKAPGKKVPTSSEPFASNHRPTMKLAELPAPPTDPLSVLGIDESFSAAALRRAWRRFASEHHPDQGGDTVTFTRGRAAYEELLARLNSR